MVSGSSPLTRGKLHDPADLVGNVRLIPAHAGKTFGGDAPPGPALAHPRSRGENVVGVGAGAGVGGSSPLTRGKLWPLLARVAA